MKLFKQLIFSALSLTPFLTIGQQKDTLSKKLDSLSVKTAEAGKQINNIEADAYNYNTNLNLKSYFQLLGSDLKQEFTKPFHMKGKDWVRLGEFTALAIGVGSADEPIQRNAVEFATNHSGIRTLSSKITKFGGVYEVYTLAALGAYGFVFKSDKVKTTTLLATQAYITAGAMETVLKYLTGRTRPSAYGPTVESEPKFYGPFSKRARNINGSKEFSSFPSGHTTVAFAAATVFAKEYKNSVVVPILAYSAATMIGLSRLTENKHWASDVLVGAALGYLEGRQVVNNYHRYAKLKDPNQKKNSLSFNVQYQFGQFMPGLVYSMK